MKKSTPLEAKNRCGPSRPLTGLMPKKKSLETLIKPRVIVILGPTASGKSALAVAIAKKVGGEIISADSRQVYKGLDIGTGKITKKEMRGIPHHLLDVASPISKQKKFTAADYVCLGNLAIKKILARHHIPIICGGTGFYIDALTYNYSLPNVLPDEKLRKKLGKLTTAALFKKLKSLDPERAKNIDPQNPARLIRALEIVIKSGLKVPPPPPKESSFDLIKIGIKKKDAELKKLISERLKKRWRTGLIAEVKKLHQKGLSFSRMEELGLEYRYVSRYLSGQINPPIFSRNIKPSANKIAALTSKQNRAVFKKDGRIKTKDELITILEKEIWGYAKRQMTWFKRDKDIVWVKNFKEALKEINPRA